MNAELQIKQWTEVDLQQLHQELEAPNWAPWLAASLNSLVGRSLTFPHGQLAVCKDGVLVASISTNQINWNGKHETLPNWDTVAGDPTTYEHTYNPEGNSLVLMSANVGGEFKKGGFGRVLINAVKQMATQIGGIDHIIGSFRPTGFGAHKAALGQNVPLEAYYNLPLEADRYKPVDATIDWTPWGGLPPKDPWFLNLGRNGMEPSIIDHNAMTVPVTAKEFLHYKKTHKPDLWKKLPGGIWLCGEVGCMYPNPDGSYTYKEPNLWGKIPSLKN